MPTTTMLLDEAHRAAALALLRAHVRSSLFLLGNLAELGPRATEHLNSADYQVVLRDGEVAAVFAHTRRGNLLLQTDRQADYADAILDALDASPFPVQGFLGDWDLIAPLRARHAARSPGWRETYASKEPIFELPLAGRPAVPTDVRRLAEADFDAWWALRLAFNAEEGLPTQGTPEQQRAAFATSCARGRQFGVARDGRLVSIAALNSDGEGAGLVGGVYTVPEARRQGLSRAVMEKLAAEARDVLGFDRLVLFTGEHNHAAQALYRGMGFTQDGMFGMIFGAAS